MKTIIKVRNLDLSFKNNHVLNDLSFDIPENKIVGLISPSGGGKTTILKCLAGLQVPNRNTIIYNDDLLLKNISHISGYSFQENSLYEDLTLEENMLFFGTQLGLREDVIRKRTTSIINILKLDGYEHIVAGKFSGGMKKRLDIAITLLDNPQILLLDEPFAGLDKNRRVDLWNLLIGLRNMGKTLILTTHLLDEFDLYADYVIKIENGKTAHQGFIDDILGFWCLKLLFSKNIPQSYFKNYNIKKDGKYLIFYFKSKDDAIFLFNKMIDTKYVSDIKEVSIFKDNSSIIY